MKIFIITVFLLTYLTIILFNRKINPLLPLFISVGLFLATQAVSLKDALLSINYNVLGIFLGTMVLSSLFIYSKAPAFFAEKLISRSKNVGIALLWVCILSGFISSFAENVATVLIVAPIAFEVSRKLKVNPVPFLIGIAVSSNLQGSATLIGDPPSIILAMSNNMNFMDFFWMKGKPSIAFFVEAGAIVSFIVLYFFFKNFKNNVTGVKEEKVKTWVPTILMSCKILALIILSFLHNQHPYSIAITCMLFGVIGIIWYTLFEKKEKFSFKKNIDWHTFFFLVGVFILIGVISRAGIIEDAADYILNITGGNLFIVFTLIVWGSVLLSAFIDNIPYVTAMIPACQILSHNMNVSPELLLFGLLIGATVGGNITPIGASANIVSIGILREKGYKVSFKDFAKIGIPFTLSAVTSAYILLWFVWK